MNKRLLHGYRVLAIFLCIICLLPFNPVSAAVTESIEVEETIPNTVASQGEESASLIEDMLVKRVHFTAKNVDLTKDTYKIDDLFEQQGIELLANVGFPIGKNLTFTEKDGYKIFSAVENAAYIRIDNNNVVCGITNWDDYAQSITDIVLAPEVVDSFETHIRALLNLDETYKLDVSRNWSENYWEFRWLKADEKGILSEYDSAKAYVDKNDGKVVSLGYFYTTSVSKEISCDAELAQSKAREYLCEHYGKSEEDLVLSVSMGYKAPDGSGEMEAQTDNVLYCYKVSVNDDALFVYVDTVNAKIVSVETFLSEKCAAFGPTMYNTRDPHGSDATAEAYSGMQSLGYLNGGCYYKDTSQLKTNIQTYINNGANEYALYIRCHGDGSSIYGVNSSLVTVWTLYPSNFSGNWHFVFLDACDSGASTNFANALHINGYSNRAFLGCFDSVGSLASATFGENFWEILCDSTSNKVQQSALDAAALITASTPISFYGDVNYNGRSWS